MISVLEFCSKRKNCSFLLLPKFRVEVSVLQVQLVLCRTFVYMLPRDMESFPGLLNVVPASFIAGKIVGFNAESLMVHAGKDRTPATVTTVNSKISQLVYINKVSMKVGENKNFPN